MKSTRPLLRSRPPALIHWLAVVAMLAGTALPSGAAGLAAAAPPVNTATHAADHAAAMAQFDRARGGDEAAIAQAVSQWQALVAQDPANPVYRCFAGAATTMQARNTLLPWKKLGYAEEGLAMIDKALVQLTPAHDQLLVGGVPASLQVRLTAAGTFNALPAMFNRGDRGARLMAELLKNPLLDTAPLGFQAAVWLVAADDAARASRSGEARQWLQKVVASGAPQAAQAQARLKSL